jgi:hypothetical protein
MKREIAAEADIEAFASETAAEGIASVSDPEPLVWIGGAQLMQIEPRRKQMIVDKILPAGALMLNR